MDSLPPKVYWILIDYLSVSDLHGLVSCSRSIQKKVKPMLYRVLRLDFDNGNVKPQTLLLLRTLMHSPELMNELCLENCALEHFVPEESWRLRWLDLRYCSGTEMFMHRLLSGHQLQLLKVLRLSGRLSRRTFLSLLVSLEENRRLEELSLRLESLPQLVGQGGYGKSLAPSKLGDSCQRLRSIILRHLETHGPRLRSATIDIRQDIDFCMPSMLFTVQDIMRIIKSCPSVEFLGLPIDFHDLFSNQARSINYPVKLQALHLRGEYGAFSEMAKNTTTLVNLFQAPPSFQIFVGYGKMLKTIHIPSSGYPLYSRVTKSQKSNYCLDL
ncbi:uncharacterized protein BKA55DRAFT_710033 [Fusarium redolens]|uniref:F-box domain-containing protein n=1 Tax=Fusarium redolens TaxID=48865 RepID=A0A9P9G8H5_FUSRE|nr:uncharacterized protein BKA55DRAFT_710033 [Fusarium redolens]KAH7233927.1 hypothetical protein BKA55DRAFT_710033 [Fusarium redolens]